MTRDEVTQALVTWILGLNLSNKVIVAYPSKKRPDIPYMSVNLENITEVRETDFTAFNVVGGPMNPERVEALVETEWEYSINAYGDNALDKVMQLKYFARVEPTNRAIPSISIQNFGPIVRLPEFLDSTWEERAHGSIFLRLYYRLEFEEPVFRTIPMVTVDTPQVDLPPPPMMPMGGGD